MSMMTVDGQRRTGICVRCPAGHCDSFGVSGSSRAICSIESWNRYPYRSSGPVDFAAEAKNVPNPHVAALPLLLVGCSGNEVLIVRLDSATLPEDSCSGAPWEDSGPDVYIELTSNWDGSTWESDTLQNDLAPTWGVAASSQWMPHCPPARGASKAAGAQLTLA
ncbi:MAG: hypothetical protein H6738_05635 [Alphaproteobacteria bacterium]|nr:hypothetical protein [Alphaproteobacteria bacterium]MCB9696250.1 hypothetical protein [Alphaproteobacteria bacterium]